MKRVSTYELTDQEQAVLTLAHAAAVAESAAHAARHRAVVAAAKMGLPTRLIGAYSDFSAAQVSRLNTGKQAIR